MCQQALPSHPDGNAQSALGGSVTSSSNMCGDRHVCGMRLNDGTRCTYASNQMCHVTRHQREFAGHSNQRDDEASSAQVHCERSINFFSQSKRPPSESESATAPVEPAGSTSSARQQPPPQFHAAPSTSSTPTPPLPRSSDPAAATFPEFECGSICEHGRLRSTCKALGSGSICEHGRQRSQCKECGGGSICEHGRQRSTCKECGGSSICEHGRRRSTCKACGGSSLCEHGRRRSRCKECGGGSLCEHGRRRSHCKNPACIIRAIHRRELGAQYLSARPPQPLSAGGAPPTASTLQSRSPPLLPVLRPRHKRPREAEVGRDYDLQLALALSISEASSHGQQEHRHQLVQTSARAEQVQGTTPAAAAAESVAGSSRSNALVDVCMPVEEEEGGGEDEEEDNECGGSCLAGLFSFDGEPCSRLDHTRTEGGWGFTSCCKNAAHFGCLGRWLNPLDGRVADSTRGPVPLDLKCPFCREPLSRSSTRMMSAEA